MEWTLTPAPSEYYHFVACFRVFNLWSPLAGTDAGKKSITETLGLSSTGSSRPRWKIAYGAKDLGEFVQ